VLRSLTFVLPWGRGYRNCCYTPGARRCKLLGKSPRQLRWGTPPPAAWRDPKTQAADPFDNLSTIVDTPPEEPPPDRFDHAPSPVRILMRDGMWLVPESERPR